MRNLKRALSLALASVMTLGMMVVGAGAAKVSDFSDATSIKNEEAATINAAIGIFEGRDDGSFDPEGVVTRAEMAVIVTKMLYGASFDAANLAGSSKFTDVPTWAEGWVNAAAANGIIVGRGNGIFDPDAQVTTAEAVVMLCKTLGYFKNEAEFGENWKLAAANLASELGIYGNLTLAVDAGLSRDNVSELAFHALTEVVPVKYNPAQDTYFTGSSWTSGIEFNYMNTLAYKNFKLIYTAGAASDSKYGRPVNKVWGIGELTSANINEDGDIITGGSVPSGKAVVKAIKSADQLFVESETADYVYTEKKTNKQIKADAGNKAVWADNNSAYLNGDDTKLTVVKGKSIYSGSDSNTFGQTQDGRITELYVDSDDNVTVVYIDQYLTKITKVGSDDDGKYVQVEGVGTPKLTNTKYYTDATYAVKDKVVVTVTTSDGGKTVEIASLYAPVVVEGSVGSRAGTKPNVTAVTIDGVKYTTVAECRKDFEFALNSKYTVYLDNNNYVIGSEKVEGVDSGNYLYVKKCDSSTAVNQNASVVFADGTQKTIVVSEDTSNANRPTGAGVFTYSEQSDGSYKLTKVTDDLVASNVSLKITKNSASIGSVAKGGTTYVATKDTKFIDVDEKKVYEGYNAVPTYDKEDGDVKGYVVGNDGKATYVFITQGTANNSSKNSTYVYVTSADAKSDAFEIEKIGGTEYAKFTAYKDGEEIVLTAKSGSDASDVIVNAKGGIFEITSVNSDGYATKITNKNSAAKVKGEVTAATDESFNIGDTYVLLTDETVFVVVDGDDVRAGDASDLVAKPSKPEAGDTWSYVVLPKGEASTEEAKLVYIYVQSK